MTEAEYRRRCLGGYPPELYGTKTIVIGLGAVAAGAVLLMGALLIGATRGVV